MSPYGVERAWEAVRIACLDRDIRAMPMKMQTFASDSVLSSAQQQRLLIARALVRRPSLLILDEALSGMDEALQRQLLTNLRSIPHLTCIVASHRPTLTALVDRTYRLERGRLAEVLPGGRPPMMVSPPTAVEPEAALFRAEAVQRFWAAEPLDRMPRL
jgi:ABC-type bacteriocin/lantibiotic exporter with double-glycine peptidase domain